MAFDLVELPSWAYLTETEGTDVNSLNDSLPWWSVYHTVMATTTHRTILSSAKVGTIPPQAARKSVMVVKHAKGGTSGRFAARTYKAASNARKTTTKK
jgi:hypothetical protein